MIIWLIFSLMTVAAVMAVLWPLSRTHSAEPEAAISDVTFYKEQSSEIDRDLERGLLTPQEAEAARIEAGRRLLRSTESGNSAIVKDKGGEPALRRRRAVSALTLSIVPLVALAAYTMHGAPDFSGRAAQQVRQTAPEQVDISSAVAQLENHLKQNPEDGRGWELIAPAYISLERLDDALVAYRKALHILGDDATRLTGYGEAQVFAAGGIVDSGARTTFERALSLKPDILKPQFYLALAAEQAGDAVKAKELYSKMLAVPSPWTSIVRERLAMLDKAADHASSEDTGPEVIQAMVESLAARIEQDGGKPEEWAQLVRSYMVLGNESQALAALGKAREAFASDKEALASFETAIRDLKLDKDGKK